MTAKTIRAGIIGCGRMAGIRQAPGESAVYSHAAAFDHHPRFALVAVADTDAERSSAFAERWGLSGTFVDPAELLRVAKPDVVSVCSPTEAHFEQILLISEHDDAPRVVFAEKPICEHPSQLDRLRSVASARGVEILVNHTRRFDPGHQRLAAAIQGDELGGLMRGHCTYYGGWMHNGSHLVDTLRMLLGDPLDVVDVRPGAPGKPGDPCWEVIFSSGSSRITVVSIDERRYQLFEIDLLFERGRALARDFGAQIIVEDVRVNEFDERVLVPRSDSPWRGLDSPLLHALEWIRAAIDDGESLLSTGASLDGATATMALLWQVTEHASDL